MGSYRLFTTPDTPLAQVELAESGMLGLIEGQGMLQAYFSSDDDLEPVLAKLNGSVDIIADEDWAETWKANIRLIHVGPLTVGPPWLCAPDEKTIVIEPEMAFGTGDHETTRGCLAMLIKNVHPGTRVCDFGCGSGILAIAAARLGATAVLAIDSDPKAVAIARRNAEINHVVIDVIDSSEIPDREFDVIVANIQSSVLLPQMPRMRAKTRILSGILREENLAFENVSARIDEGLWTTFEISI